MTEWTSIGKPNSTWNGTAPPFVSTADTIISAADYGTMSDILTAVGSDNRTVYINKDITISSTTTLSTNISTIGVQGAMFHKVGTGQIVFNGPFSAGLYQVFSGFSAGDVTFGNGVIKQQHLEWYGGKADNLTDNSTALAIARDASKAEIGLGEGTYKGNVTIAAKSNFSMRGQSSRSTWLKPFTSAPVITLDSTSGSMQYTTLRDFGLDNTGSGFLNDGIKLTGNNINDYLLFERLYIQSFVSGIKVNGRTILSRFQDVLVQNSTGNGIHVEQASNVAPFNANTFNNVASNGSTGHGFYIKDTGGVGTAGFFTNNFYSINAEANGGSGFRLDGLNGGLSGGGGIYNSYIENNTDRGFYATGTLLIGFSFNNNLCWGSGATYDYENAVTLATGEVKGNRMSKGARFALASDSAQIEYGVNYGPAPVITADGNGRTHVNITTPLTYTDGATQITNPVAVSALTLTGSPLQYTNTNKYDVDLFYVGGTVTQVYLNRGAWGGDYVPLNSIYRLSPGDIIYFTYTVNPTHIWLVPR